MEKPLQGSANPKRAGPIFQQRVRNGIRGQIREFHRSLSLV